MIRATNDFGANVRCYWFPGNPSRWPPLEVITRNMKEVAKFEGFRLDISGKDIFYYMRDVYVRLRGGRVVSCGFESTNIQRAVQRSLSKMIHFGNSSAVMSSHPFHWGANGTVVKSQVDAFTDYYRRMSRDLEELRFYLEGGDLFTLTNPAEKRKVLLGRDAVDLIHNHWRLDHFFDEKKFGERGEIYPQSIARIEEDLTHERINAVATEMFAMGLLNFGREKRTGMIEFSEVCKIEGGVLPSENVYQLARRAGLIKPLTLSQKELEAAKPMVAKFLAQREMIMMILSKSLGVELEDIHLISKAGYHLDTFMMPGPHRKIFLQSYALCLKELEKIRAEPEDSKILDWYIITAESQHRDLGPILMRVRRELEEAGFDVIDVPGVFLNHPCGKSWHVNFLNAISGWSEKNRRPYLVTNGAQAGKNLGSSLMKIFEDFMLKHEPNLKVHFVGNEDGDFSSAMQLWDCNQPDQGPLAGVHCLTFEGEMAPHPTAPADEKEPN